ncbi:MAG: aconitate hydratase AcnA, partial [Acidimicrobiales bacterium]
ARAGEAGGGEAGGGEAGSGAGEAGGGEAGGGAGRPVHAVPVRLADGREFELDHGHVVIAAITSCTNTSNPHVMLAAGLLAKEAVARGLETKPWVKTSLAPGSRVAMDYFKRAGLDKPLETLGFDLVGFGCTTCIGNSGPLLPEISAAINDNGLACVSVLSGNRNFEGRIHPDVRMNYLASPPLVVAYAIAGTLDADIVSEPLGYDRHDEPVYLRDIWPSPYEVVKAVEDFVDPELYRRDYADVFAGDAAWNDLDIPTGDRYAWDEISTYVRQPPYFDGLEADPPALSDVHGARVLAVLGDSVTTDHISPAGSIKLTSPAGTWLVENGVEAKDFNSYGSRRGNHEVMVRGTFANTRLRNHLAPGTEGGVTLHLPDGGETTIFEAATAYADEGVPLVVLAGKEYGAGSSRDWAAKGPALLGVRAVIAESFERIHRSNLIGMGVLPLQLPPGESPSSLDSSSLVEITGIEGLAVSDLVGAELTVRAGNRELLVRLRVDTPGEAAYLYDGGILQYVVRQLAGT